MSGTDFAKMDNASKIQSVLSDDLFPSVNHVSDVKQVLEFMTGVAAPITEPQIRGLILLEALGKNERLHGKADPYKAIRDKIGGDYKKAIADTSVYLDTIAELIPKPPRPIIMADKMPVKPK
jgi:hypothetical protein